MAHNSDEPDPLFSCGLIDTQKVVSINITYQDGTKEFLDFPEGNLPSYRVKGNILQKGDKTIKQFFEHEILWTENYWQESDVRKQS